MNSSAYKTVFDGPIDSANVTLKINSLAGSDNPLETLINVFATGESFAALIAKSNPLLAGISSAGTLAIDLEKAREQIEAGSSIDHDVLLRKA